MQERARLRPGETLLVLGAAGGTGLSAVEFGKLMGARVIAAASSPEKLALCREYGADETIDYSKDDLKDRLKQITGGRGVDVVYDPVGGDYTETALRCMAWEGRLIVIGFTAGTIPRPALNLPLWLLHRWRFLREVRGAAARAIPGTDGRADGLVGEWAHPSCSDVSPAAGRGGRCAEGSCRAPGAREEHPADPRRRARALKRLMRSHRDAL